MLLNSASPQEGTSTKVILSAYIVYCDWNHIKWIYYLGANWHFYEVQFTCCEIWCVFFVIVRSFLFFLMSSCESHVFLAVFAHSILLEWGVCPFSWLAGRGAVGVDTRTLLQPGSHTGSVICWQCDFGQDMQTCWVSAFLAIQRGW